MDSCKGGSCKSWSCKTSSCKISSCKSTSCKYAAAGYQEPGKLILGYGTDQFVKLSNDIDKGVRTQEYLFFTEQVPISINFLS